MKNSILVISGILLLFISISVVVGMKINKSKKTKFGLLHKILMLKMIIGNLVVYSIPLLIFRLVATKYNLFSTENAGVFAAPIMLAELLINVFSNSSIAFLLFCLTQYFVLIRAYKKKVKEENADQ